MCVLSQSCRLAALTLRADGTKTKHLSVMRKREFKKNKKRRHVIIESLLRALALIQQKVPMCSDGGQSRDHTFSSIVIGHFFLSLFLRKAFLTSRRMHREPTQSCGAPTPPHLSTTPFFAHGRVGVFLGGPSGEPNIGAGSMFCVFCLGCTLITKGPARKFCLLFLANPDSN